MANDPRTEGGGSGSEGAANAARQAAKRRERGGGPDVQPGGPSAPAEVPIPGQHEERTPGREASPDVGVPRPEPEREIPGHTGGEPDPEIAPPRHAGSHDTDPPAARRASPEEAPELLDERSGYPSPFGFGEDPGDLGPERS